MEDIEILLVRSRLRWLGHVSRMEDDRPVKSLLYGELTEGTRPVGRPKLRYKDTCKSALKCGNALGQWKAMVENRTEWRHTILLLKFSGTPLLCLAKSIYYLWD